MHQRTRPTTTPPAPTSAASPAATRDRVHRPPTTALDRQVDAAWLTGVISGCVRGLLAGRRHALRTVLRARFGPLPPDLSHRLADIDLNHIEAWLTAAATAPDLDGVSSAVPAVDGADADRQRGDGAALPPDGTQRVTR